MDRFGTLEDGKRADGLSRLLLRETDFIKALQIEPEFRAGAEEMSKTQGCITGDRPLTVQNASNAVGRHVELAGQLSGTHAELLQFFSQVFPRVDSGRYHGLDPFLVVINNLYIHRSRRSGMLPFRSSRCFHSPSHASVTDIAPCSLRVARTVISTSWPRAVRKVIRRSTEKLPERLRISSDTCGWAMPMTSPACAWVSLRALMMR